VSGPTIPDTMNAVTSDDADQASAAVPSMKCLNQKGRYAEAANGNREYFWNKPHKAG